jgi:DNA mismatch endonuclease, patch repair protein
MTDVLTPEQRRRNMSSIRSRNTKPEILVRQLIHGLGYRFRLHGQKIPGRPDIILPKLRRVVFINGCFWHMHNCKYGRVVPKTNADFWKLKRLSNKERDRKNLRILKKQGWKVLVIWECKLKEKQKLERNLMAFLQTKKL